MPPEEPKAWDLRVLTWSPPDSSPPDVKFLFASDIYIAVKTIEENQVNGVFTSVELEKKRDTARHQISSYEKRPASKISCLAIIKLGRRSGLAITSVAEFEYLMTFISLSTAHRAAFLAR